MLELTKELQFSMVCTLKNDVKMFKTQVEPQATGASVSLQCFEHNFLTSFLWAIRVQSMENCCWFVIYYNVVSTSISVEFPRKSGMWERKKIKTIKLRHHHFHGLYSYRTYSSRPISTQGNKSLSHGKIKINKSLCLIIVDHGLNAWCPA